MPIPDVDFECSNECSIPQFNECDLKATCTDKTPGYECECNTGYRGDGTECTDIDECAEGNCHVDGHCTNFNGSYTCVCEAPFYGNGSYCEYDCYHECHDWLPTASGVFDATYISNLTLCKECGVIAGTGANQTLNTTILNPICGPCCKVLAPASQDPCIGYWLANDPFGKQSAPQFSSLLFLCNFVILQADVPYVFNGTCAQTLDYCFFGADQCDSNAKCINDPSYTGPLTYGYTCECNQGYTGNGLVCTSTAVVDPCLEHQCPNTTTCVLNNTVPKGRICNCTHAGYWFSETSNSCYDPCDCASNVPDSSIFLPCAPCLAPVNAASCAPCCPIIQAAAQSPCAYYTLANLDDQTRQRLITLQINCVNYFNTSLVPSTYCTGTCSDNVKKGYETDIDCGGPCQPCATEGLGCAIASDCAPGFACKGESAEPKSCISSAKEGGKDKAGLTEYAILVAVVGVIILVAGVLITWWWWRQVLIADQGYRYAQSNSITGQVEGASAGGVEVTDLTGVPPPGDVESPGRGTGDDEVYVS
eukprot:TRINITY_DN603_c0_g1_i12.p1 TRINITY_DN603_c0_g1~~TRINITY_DN603_c0_g1_i12.p1  ORF type:complete len:614 (-),score=60.56 TRINITY_DN603_c0_g1_i12:90-1691(-)